MNNTSNQEDLRTSVYPRALVIDYTRFGVTTFWWLLIAVLGLMLFLLGVMPIIIAVFVLAIYVIGYIATRWDVHHVAIYKQYSKQSDAYEPGFFLAQNKFKRPEHMGREYLG